MVFWAYNNFQNKWNFQQYCDKNIMASFCCKYEIQLMMQVMNNMRLVKLPAQCKKAAMRCLNVWNLREGEFIEIILVTLN